MDKRLTIGPSNNNMNEIFVTREKTENDGDESNRKKRDRSWNKNNLPLLDNKRNSDDESDFENNNY